jgi:hypothetical protein
MSKQILILLAYRIPHIAAHPRASDARNYNNNTIDPALSFCQCSCFFLSLSPKLNGYCSGFVPLLSQFPVYFAIKSHHFIHVIIFFTATGTGHDVTTRIIIITFFFLLIFRWTHCIL